MEEPKVKRYKIKREDPYTGRNDGPGPAPDSVRPDNIPYSTSIEAHRGFCNSIGVNVDSKEAVEKVQKQGDNIADIDREEK